MVVKHVQTWLHNQSLKIQHYKGATAAYFLVKMFAEHFVRQF